MKRLIKESGIRDIKNLSKRYPKAKIYFHQDLDGVTTAIAMKEYLESNNIDVVDAEIIQYGDKEFAIKKLDAKGDIMPVLVDFAHGKPMFVIHTDHHDTQAGVEDGTATSFRSSRSNVETISQSVSPKEIFSNEDITLISTVDSANFAQYNISVDDVINYLFKIDRNSDVKKNKMLMGLVANKLLLAFKNKPGFLEELVLYTPFKNNPDADFLVIAWPMGLVQASCNPYKKERALKGVDLGQIKNEVLDEMNPELESIIVPLSTLKVVSEQKATFSSVGFTFKDFMAIYGKSPSLKVFGRKETLFPIIENIMDRPYKKLSVKQIALLDKVVLNGRDIINANSGGHKCITNISGINSLYRKKDGNGQKSYVDLTKEIQQKFYEILQTKINSEK